MRFLSKRGSNNKKYCFIAKYYGGLFILKNKTIKVACLMTVGSSYKTEQMILQLSFKSLFSKKLITSLNYNKK